MKTENTDGGLGNLALKFMIDEVRDVDTARRCLKAYVDVLEQDRQIPRAEAVAIAKSNLGYLAGYRGHDVRLRVERLYNCVHPLFGKADDIPPSLEKRADVTDARNKGITQIYPQPEEDV